MSPDDIRPAMYGRAIANWVNAEGRNGWMYGMYDTVTMNAICIAEYDRVAAAVTANSADPAEHFGLRIWGGTHHIHAETHHLHVETMWDRGLGTPRPKVGDEKCRIYVKAEARHAAPSSDWNRELSFIWHTVWDDPNLPV